MERWQPAGLTEGQWRDVVAPPPSPAATVPLPMASPQGGFGSRHHDRRETAIDHARAVERIVRGIMLHPFVGHHLFPALGAGFLVGPFDPAVDDRFAIFFVRGPGIVGDLAAGDIVAPRLADARRAIAADNLGRS